MEEIYFEHDLNRFYRAGETAHGSAQGSIRLLFEAVLLDAVREYLYCNFNNIPASSSGGRRAREWFYGHEDESHLFSFKSVCEVLGLSPCYVRIQLPLLLKEARMRRWRT
jgi:hypothetical protein